MLTGKVAGLMYRPNIGEKLWHCRRFFPSACCFAAQAMILGGAVYAQTTCANQHAEIGVFICDPIGSPGSEGAAVPSVFHLSAQGNGSPGQLIRRYAVLIDDHLLYENRLSSPVRTLSIETNLKSPFDSGLHTLQLVMDGVGTAEVKNMKIHAAEDVGFCNPFSRFGGGSCNLSDTGGTLYWSLEEPNSHAASGENVRRRSSFFDVYLAYKKLFGRNLKSVEADVFDAMAVDSRGDLYVASHVFNDVELRKYTTNGSIVYDNLIHSCGEGYLSVVGLAIDIRGLAWIAGNTTACLLTNPPSVESNTSGNRSMRGFLMLVDTKMPSSAPPLSVSYVSSEQSRISAIRVDDRGNAYIIGSTSFQSFPHNLSLVVPGTVGRSDSKNISFVSMLKPLASTFSWSTLLPDTYLTALALDAAGNVFVTGRAIRCGLSGTAELVCNSVLVAELSDRGRRLSYAAQFGGTSNAEARQISTIAQGEDIVVTGETDSPWFPAPSATKSHTRSLQTFMVALEPCRNSVLHSWLATFESGLTPAIALSSVLDAFSSSRILTAAIPEDMGATSLATVNIARVCSTMSQ